MQYNNFIQSSLRLIKKSRQSIGYNIKTKSAKIPPSPSNLYIELFLQKNDNLFKIQQWNFICLKNLVQSQYQSNGDSQLDQIELQQKPYLRILQEKLEKFNQKLLLKRIQPNRLIMNIITNEQQLTKFEQTNLLLINVSEYQGETFSCKITLQTVHEDPQINIKNMSDNVKQGDYIQQFRESAQNLIKVYSSEQEFQVLVDSEYQKMKSKQKCQAYSKQTKKQIRQNQLKKQDKRLKNNNEQSYSNTLRQYMQKQKQRNRQQQKRQPSTSMKNIEVQQKHSQKQQQTVHMESKQVWKVQKVSQSNMQESKYSTKQIILSDYERKITLVNQTIELIEQINIGSTNLKKFLKKLE